MASVWQFASTRDLIFLADAQSADPEELQVLDTFLSMKCVIRASGANTLKRTAGSLQMTPSPSLRHTQHSNIGSHIPVHANQSRPR
jgi:hypothetical protein